MKKLLFVLALGAFAACGNGDSNKNNTDSATTMTDTTTTMTDTTTMPMADTTNMKDTMRH